MKTCLFCAEEIQTAAIKCKHCHEFLDESTRPHRIYPGPPPQPDSLPWYFKTGFIVLMFLSLPPLALPSVWFHPKMHFLWKGAITIAVVGFCWVSFIAFKGFVTQLDEAVKMFSSMKI